MPNYRILLLEDDESLNDVLRDVLEEEGFEVDVCAKSDDAINLARQKEYDLMVADIRMEGLDGLAALSHVQSYRPTVDALVISGYADSKQAARASRLGLGAVLKKPFDLDHFLDKVNGLLRDRSKKLAVKQAFESLLSSAYWSTVQLARFLDNSSSAKFNFRQLVDVTGMLCSEMNLLGSQLEKVRSATLAAAWRQSRKECSLPPPDNVPEEFEYWFRYLAEWWDGSGPQKLQGREQPLESRIIVTALASCLEATELEELKEKWPGRFDPNLIGILERQLELDDQEHPSETAESSEGLLDLAQTLLRSGDFHSASEALQQVVNRGADSREGVSALLMLARLRQRSGLFEEAKTMAFRTPELASSFGPALAAHAYLESGKLLLELGESSSAVSSLERAYSLYLDLGLEAQAAQCFLLAKVSEGSLLLHEESARWLEVLLSPQHRLHAADLAPLLVGHLLSSDTLPPQFARHLARLFVGHPYSAESALDDASPQEQLRALSFLKEIGPEKFSRVGRFLAQSQHSDVRKVALTFGGTTDVESVGLPLNVTSFGGLKVEAGDQQIPDRAWKTSKVRYLFARLVTAYPNPVNEDVLIEEFWPGDVEKGRKSLYTATSSVRSALRKSGLVSKEFVQKSPTGLVIAEDLTLNFDVDYLKEALEQARKAEAQGATDAALVAYRKAVILGEQSFLPNCYYDWASVIRETLNQDLLLASVRLTQISFINERFSECIEFARRALKFDSANETAAGLLIEALISVGRPAEAVREFQVFSKVLEVELGIKDATKMQDLRMRATAGLVRP